MYVLPWLNIVEAVQMFFVKRFFVSFMTLSLNKIRINNKWRQTQLSFQTQQTDFENSIHL